MNTITRIFSLVVLVCLLVATSHSQSFIGAAHLGGLSSNSGIALDSIDDVNGDGVTDLVVGANFTATNFLSAGSVSILSGTDLSLLLQVDGIFQSQQLGRAVAGVDDLSGDGIPDLVGGSIFHDSNGLNGAGHVAVFSGADGSFLYAVDGTATNGRFGSQIVSLGDVDGDTLGDFAVTAPEANTSAGQVKIISGATGSVLHSMDGNTSARFGWDIDRVGDLDGDGRDDLMVCATTEAGVGGLLQAGRVRIFSSATGNLIRDFTGSPTGDGFNLNAAGLSDLNGDGVAEYVVATPSADNGTGLNNEGQIFVYDGMTGTLLINVGGGYNGANFGEHVAGIGDWNADGTDDFIASAVIPNFNLAVRSLRVLSGVDGSTLEVIAEETGGIFSGFGLQSASPGDVNGDGRADIVTSNPYVAVTGTSGTIGAGLTRLYLAPGPVVRRVGRFGHEHRLDLRWLPQNADPFATTGDLICDGATPGGFGAVVASLDGNDLTLYGYLPVLVNLDPFFVGYLATFGFDGTGTLMSSGLTRQYPTLQGLHLHLQVFELSPVAASSNALVFELLP